MRALPRTPLACACLLLLAGCGAHTVPATRPPPTRLDPGAVRALARDLEAILASPGFEPAHVGMLVQSLDSGTTLFEHDATKLFIPASNQKLVTLAVAAERLGWDFRFETTLATSAPVEQGTLRGDLIVIGGGDPTIGTGEDTTGVFRTFAEALRAAGISRIEGRIVGDDDAFEDERFGAEWAWDDFVYDYAAPVGALQYAANSVGLRMTAAGAAGAAAAVVVEDESAGLDVRSEVTTGEAGTTASISVARFPGSNVIEVKGSVPLGGPPVERTVSVDNPTLYFVRALKKVLQGSGVDVFGDATDIDDLPPGSRTGMGSGGFGAASRLIYTYRSAPLSEVGTTLMKVSQNLYAETLLKRSGTGLVATTASGRASASVVLRSWGVDSGGYLLFDGSGLSRRDYVSPDTLVRILRHMAMTTPHAAPFEATLPVAGLDGTLEARMKGTPAEGNAHAKTGTLSQVRSLSGYVTAANGIRLVFSILVNGFTVPGAELDDLVDRAVVRIARFPGR